MYEEATMCLAICVTFLHSLPVAAFAGCLEPGKQPILGLVQCGYLVNRDTVVRVRRHFGARGRSSVRYGTRLGDLKENWFLLFSN